MYYTSELHGAMGLFFSYAGPVMMEHPGGVYVHVYTHTFVHVYMYCISMDTWVFNFSRSLIHVCILGI